MGLGPSPQYLLDGLMILSDTRILFHKLSTHCIYFRLRDNGIEVKNVGTGSTPSASHPSDRMKNLTELHPGNYIFYGEYWDGFHITWANLMFLIAIEISVVCSQSYGI